MFTAQAIKKGQSADLPQKIHDLCTKNIENENNITEEEIRIMVDLGEERGAIAPEEGTMIDNVLESMANQDNEDMDKIIGIIDRSALNEERKDQLAGTMSGGERKMLAIGRGMMSDPKLLLVDEPSFGLAPQLTQNVFESLDVLIKADVTIMLVEQNVTKTLSVTNRGYILENGKIGLEGKSSDLACDPYVKKVFLGV